MEVHGGLTDRLDLIEYGLTILSPDHVAQHAAQKANRGSGLGGFVHELTYYHASNGR